MIKTCFKLTTLPHHFLFSPRYRNKPWWWSFLLVRIQVDGDWDSSLGLRFGRFGSWRFSPGPPFIPTWGWPGWGGRLSSKSSWRHRPGSGSKQFLFYEYVALMALHNTHFGLSGGLVTTEEALLTSLGPTGSFCLALLANVLPANPGDLGR